MKLFLRYFLVWYFAPYKQKKDQCNNSSFIQNWGPKLISKIKDCASLKLYKDKIKTWCHGKCQCQICWKYIGNLDYFQFAFLRSKVDTKQSCTVVNCKWSKCPFPVKAMYVSSWLWSNFISYVKVLYFL